MKEDGRDEMTDEELKSLADEKEAPQEEEPKEDVKDEPQESDEEEPKSDVEESEKELEEKSDDEPKDEPSEKDDVKEDDEPSKDEPKEEDGESDEEDTKENKDSNIRKMKENFSLLKAIRSIVDGKQFDTATQAVLDEGRAEMRSAGLSTVGQIVIPTRKRSVVTVAGEGEDLVETEISDQLLMPLREKNVAVAAGAKLFTNLQGNLQVPIMGRNSVGFEGEIDPAKDGAGEFTNVQLKPCRICGYVDISKQALIQSTPDIENAILEDLGNALNGKVEGQLFSDSTGDTNSFAGIFSQVAPTAVSDFKGVVDKEAEIEENCVFDNLKYVVSPKAKAAFRAMSKGTKSTQLVWESNAVDGTPALSTGHVKGKNYIYGDFSNVAIGTWGPVDITVDTISQAIYGKVRITVNMYVDAKVLRPEAFTAGTLA